MESSALSFVGTLEMKNVLNKLNNLAKGISRQIVEIATWSFPSLKVKCKRRGINSEKFH